MNDSAEVDLELFTSYSFFCNNGLRTFPDTLNQQGGTSESEKLDTYNGARAFTWQFAACSERYEQSDKFAVGKSENSRSDAAERALSRTCSHQN
jgi:hypothetical protein